jgi:hypothetical protein
MSGSKSRANRIPFKNKHKARWGIANYHKFADSREKPGRKSNRNWKKHDDSLALFTEIPDLFRDAFSSPLSENTEFLGWISKTDSFRATTTKARLNISGPETKALT